MTSYILSASRRYLSNYQGLSGSCWRGIILSFIESILIGVYSFLPLYFINDLKFSVATAGVIIGFYGAGAVLGGYISGKFCDKYSSGVVSVVSLLLQSIAFFLLVRFNTFNYLACDMFLMGVASYAFLTALHLWVLNECLGIEDKKLKALNILNAASNLGSGLSALIIGFLVIFGFNHIFSIVGMLLLFSAIYFSSTLMKGSVPKATNSQVKQNHAEVNNTKSKNGLVVWLVLGCLFIVGLIIFQANTTFSIYIQEKYPKLGIQAVSILFSVNCFMVVLFQTPLVNVFSKYNKLLIVGAGAFLLGFGMLMLTFAASFIFAILAYAIHTIGEMLFFSVAQFVCYESVAANKKGQVMGMYRMIYAGSRVIAPAAGGLIYQSWGGNTLWYLCGLLGILCFEACNLGRNIV